MRETRWNTIEYSPPFLPTDARHSPTDKTPVINGQASYNWYCTAARTLRKRPGSQPATNFLAGKVIKKIWLYETLPVAGATPYAYLIFSARDNTTGLFSLYSHRYDAGNTTPTAVTALRQSNSSEQAHVMTFSKGLAYVKGFPTAASGEKYGTIILDGSSGSIVVRPWGMAAPTTPARISGWTSRLTASVSSTATTLNVVTTTGSPATPFNISMGYEICNVTAKGATTFTVTRGYLGTDAQEHDDDEVVIYRDWSASDHKIDVNLGWRYAYSYVSITGQVSNRSDVEYNPDLMPSNTGPFFDLIPKITVVGDADTTNIPYINIYRTTDGGGTFYFLERITNTGAGNITYLDDSFGTGASSTTFADPVPDDKLDVNHYAPSLTSNSPPPGVIPPQVVGTDTPSKACYSMCTYSSRIWYGVDNYLFFSSREETREGVGEECFPSGNLGNFFVFDSAIIGVAGTVDSLYVLTTRDVYRLSGTSLDTFSFSRIAADIGCYVGNGSVESFRNNVAFISNDGQVFVIDGDVVSPISEPLGWFPFSYYLNGQSNPDITYYRDSSQEWLIVGICNANTGIPDTVGIMWVYDIRKSEVIGAPFWNPPWYVAASAMGSFRSVRTDLSKFFWATANSVAGQTTFVNSFVLNPNDALYSVHNDYLVNPVTGGQTATPYLGTLQLGPVSCPSGFNLNQVNSPRRDVRLYSVMVSYDNLDSLSAFPAPSLYKDQVVDLVTPVTADPPRIPITAAGGGDYVTFEYFYDAEVNIGRIIFQTEANSKTVEIFQIFVTFDAKANP